MPRTTFTGLAGPSFIAQQGLEDRDNGHQIDWANVTAGTGDPVPALNAQGKKVLLAGTRVGTLLGSGKVSPRAANTNPAVGLLATNAVEGETHAASSGYGLIVGGVIYENFIPGATAGVLDQDIKDELAAAGTGFTWRTYADDRA